MSALDLIQFLRLSEFAIFLSIKQLVSSIKTDDPDA
jgi:hypothetical protein